jgi:thioredoxin reductase (NADPH)
MKRGKSGKSENCLFDAVIIGGGPAGLAAGTHLARAGYSALLIERQNLGGQARGLERIENYPGFPRGVSGAKLMDLWLEQAKRWKLKTKPGEAVSISRGADGIFSVRLKNRGALYSRSVLWCAGAAFCRLDVPGENKLLGRGVWNTCDEAPSCAGLTAAVVGAGEAAVQQAIILARKADRVYLVTRSGKLKAHKLLLARLSRSGAVRLPGFSVSRLLGKSRLETVELISVSGPRQVKKLEVSALFTLIGKEPHGIPAAWRRKPAGFFEAGDCAAGIFRQVAVAGGDGIRAAMRCIRYLEGM